jgi:TRAP-type C4-dicarboxylate transport system permease small subunit
MDERESLQNLLKRWDKRLSFSVEVLCVVLLAAIVATVSISVFTRFVVFYPLNFADALTKYLLMWVVFLGVGLALREGEHIAVDILVYRLRGAPKAALTTTVTLFISLFLGIVAYFGFRNAWQGRELHDPLVFGVSMMVPYLAVPVGACNAIVQLNLAVWIDILERRDTDPGVAP